MTDENPHNKLAGESSPYLLQHADNPVNWFPWGKEAFEQARAQDKPVFLSIGYATCHWCHVMAHESFEDEQVAELMNTNFINIKVDREERPDIDNTYMLVCQMLTGSGGWPMSVFLTPDKKPFYAATYIPRQGRHGRPGMLELLPRLTQLWEEEREKIASSTEEIVSAFRQSNTFKPGDRLSEEVLQEAYSGYSRQFDEKFGGFGSAPKFPSPHNLMMLLRYARRHPNSEALQMVEQTLIYMRRGGLFDHIGLGFHRYATDRQWLVPHFEKMLYDQAMLLIAYIEAWQMTVNPLFKDTAEEIISYLLRKMQDGQGGFYSAEDADSEGEEGKFYLWSTSEIRETLPVAEAELFIEAFNLTGDGNYKDEATGQRTGKNIPHLKKPIDRLAHERDLSPEELSSHLESIRQKLLEQRQKRTPPLLDDKILTDWNGLVIAALAKAGRVFQNSRYTMEAQRCLKFITDNLLNEETRLKHRWRDGEAAVEAHADDYAFLIWGLLELYESSYHTRYLQQAIALNEEFLRRYWDEKDGGFYFTSETAEKLLGRKKEIYDGAIPSGNSVALMNLLRLGRLTGQTEWEEKADQMIRLFASDVKNAPTGFSFFLQGVLFVNSPTNEVVIAGPARRQDTVSLLRQLQTSFTPHAVSLLSDPDDRQIRELVSYLSDFGMVDKKATAYVCRSYSCELPVHDAEQMMELLAR